MPENKERQSKRPDEERGAQGKARREDRAIDSTDVVEPIIGGEPALEEEKE